MGTAERKLEILSYLCRERKATMPQLAEEFGVTVKTIQRDILDIQAIFHAPLVITRGKHGGISVFGDYSFDRAYMCEEELLLLKKIQDLIKDKISEHEISMLAGIIKKYSKSA